MPELPASFAEAVVMPGSLLLASVLAQVDVTDLRDDADVLEAIAGWERVIAWAQARQLAAIAEFARRPWVVGPDPDAGWAARGRPGSVAREFADDEIAARLATSGLAAGAKVEIAAALARPLTATAAALERGEIDLAKARVIVEGCRHTADDVALAVEARVLPVARTQNTSRVRKALGRALIDVDRVAAEQRHADATRERFVHVTPAPDGMADLHAHLTAAQAMAIDTALTAAARTHRGHRQPGEARTVDQLRADLLAAPFEAALGTGVLAGAHLTRLASEHGARAAIQVTVPASVLLGIGDAPGELAGYGPITADVARRIAEDAGWRRIITDPIDGSVLAVDTHAYRPSPALQRHVETRDLTCRFPGCNRRARSCDLDHTTAHPTGGTRHTNLGPLCRRHHRFKHAVGPGANDRLKQITPGVFVWTMPTGHIYRVGPPAIAPPLPDELGH